MANCYIDFICQQQDIIRHDSRVVAEGANVLYTRFYLCPKWDGFTIYARFKHQAASYDVLLDENRCALVPWEVVKYTGFEVSLYGEKPDGSRLTSETVFVPVNRSIDAETVAPLPYTPSMIELFLARAASAEAAAGAVAGEVANAELIAERAALSATRAAAASENATKAANEAAEAVESLNMKKPEEWTFVLEDGSTVKKSVYVK